MDTLTQTTTAAAMVAAARARIESLSPAAVAVEIESDETLLVDIRESDERATGGFIRGALPVPRGVIEFYADPTTAVHRPEFRFDRRIILYCASGNRSALATDSLQTLGFRRVAHLDGGFKAWKDQGLPIHQV